MGAATVRLRRVYDEPAGDDGVRVLVDRVWPRGLSKESAHIDEWCKQVAPSTELRRWYAHDPERAEALAGLRRLAARGTVTLLTATRDIETSQAAVLAEMLRA